MDNNSYCTVLFSILLSYKFLLFCQYIILPQRWFVLLDSKLRISEKPAAVFNCINVLKDVFSLNLPKLTGLSFTILLVAYNDDFGLKITFSCSQTSNQKA